MEKQWKTNSFEGAKQSYHAYLGAYAYGQSAVLMDETWRATKRGDDMYTAFYVQAKVEAMKAQNVPKADIIRATAEMRLGWQYVYASQGQDCTPEWRRSRIPYCPSQKYVDMINNGCPVLSGKQSACDGCGYVDTDVFDCAGFVLNEMQLAGVPFYGQGATTQWNTPSNWAAKGEISTMPKNLVCAIYKRKDDKMSHAGIYLGKWVKDILFDSDTGQQYPDKGPEIIHCSTTVKTDTLPGRPAWTHWGIPKGLYSTDELKAAGIDVREDDNMPTLRRGNKGEAVEELQALLNAKFGFDLEIDGDFGKATETAVKEFQKKHGLTADGVVGKKTWAALGVSPEIVNPTVDNGNNDIKPSEPPVVAPEGTLTDEAKTAIRAAYASAMTACSILKKLLEGD